MSSLLNSFSSSRANSSSLSSWPSWLSSGSIYEISGSNSSSSSSNNQRTIVNILEGETFADLVKNTPYGGTLRIELNYEIRLVHKQLHWMLLINAEDSDVYISIEVTTSDMSTLVPLVRIFQDEESTPASTLVVTRKLKLANIASAADTVVQTMGTYHFILRNCQHFCNTWLEFQGCKTFPTTIGPRTAYVSDQDKHGGFDSIRAIIGAKLGNFFVVPRGLESVVARIINARLVRNE